MYFSIKQGKQTNTI